MLLFARIKLSQKIEMPSNIRLSLFYIRATPKIYEYRKK